MLAKIRSLLSGRIKKQQEINVIEPAASSVSINSLLASSRGRSANTFSKCRAFSRDMNIYGDEDIPCAKFYNVLWNAMYGGDSESERHESWQIMDEFSYYPVVYDLVLEFVEYMTSACVLGNGDIADGELESLCYDIMMNSSIGYADKLYRVISYNQEHGYDEECFIQTRGFKTMQGAHSKNSMGLPTGLPYADRQSVLGELPNTASIFKDMILHNIEGLSVDDLIQGAHQMNYAETTFPILCEEYAKHTTSCDFAQLAGRGVRYDVFDTSAVMLSGRDHQTDRGMSVCNTMTRAASEDYLGTTSERVSIIIMKGSGDSIEERGLIGHALVHQLVPSNTDKALVIVHNGTNIALNEVRDFLSCVGMTPHISVSDIVDDNAHEDLFECVHGVGLVPTDGRSDFPWVRGNADSDTDSFSLNGYIGKAHLARAVTKLAGIAFKRSHNAGFHIKEKDIEDNWGKLILLATRGFITEDEVPAVLSYSDVSGVVLDDAGYHSAFVAMGKRIDNRGYAQDDQAMRRRYALPLFVEGAGMYGEFGNVILSIIDKYSNVAQRYGDSDVFEVMRHGIEDIYNAAYNDGYDYIFEAVKDGVIASDLLA